MPLTSTSHLRVGALSLLLLTMVLAIASCSTAASALDVRLTTTYASISRPNNTEHWTRTEQVTKSIAGFSSISCPKPTFCAAVGTEGTAYTELDGSWSAGQQLEDSPNNLLTSVSCPIVNFCKAVDFEGNVYTYANGTWSAGEQLDTSAPTSISCPTITFCAVADADGDVLTYRNGIWSGALHFAVVDGRDISGVSCPTSRFCIAVDEEGYSFRYTGRSWSHGVLIEANPNSAPTAVSCVSNKFCVVIDSVGDVLMYSGGKWARDIGIDDNPASNRNDYPNSVSCSTTRHCEFVDGAGYVFTYSRGVWTKGLQIDSTSKTSLNSVSCPTNSACSAVDSDGFVFNRGMPGQTTNADYLWPCSYVPTRLINVLGIRASSTLLPGTTYIAGTVYACSLRSANGNYTATFEMGTVDPQGTNGYVQIALNTTIGSVNVLEKLAKESVNRNAEAFIDSPSGGYQPKSFYVTVTCRSCSVRTALGIDKQIAANAIPSIVKNEGRPPPGQLVVGSG